MLLSVEKQHFADDDVVAVVAVVAVVVVVSLIFVELHLPTLDRKHYQE